MSTESELEAKYDAAVKRYETAKQAETAAKKERDEKEACVRKTQKGTKQYFLAWAEKHRAEIVFTEKVEQRCDAEYKRDLCYADWMKYRHGADSKEAQIAQHRAELARTMEFVYSGSSPYWIKWDKLCSKVWWVYYLLKAEGYDNVADELRSARKVFCNRIKEESNGKTFRNARNAALVALKKWEKEDARVAWDEAKPKYDTALAKWNEFKPKGEKFAEELENEKYELVKNSLTVYAIVSKCKSSALKNDLDRKSQTIDDLNDQLDQKDDQIAALNNKLHQKSQEHKENRTWIGSLIHTNQTLANSLCKQVERPDTFQPLTLVEESQNWLEGKTSSHANLANWIQKKIAKMAAL
ncbi:uncharacterized protein TM35_000151770 [Trypanosoma theileri]|uniref:Uncharacterized protein n=1 Tax=Trypanosoma theileri TaxID=67003 RepID=A0A1X0NVK5_9TRYP|nr:uncharacterized protein TM35_000151770 [Trypanosoma theileri]ORC88746.1 hypothetical protein TM35_000151770 [Trypanosoma theileri]